MLSLLISGDIQSLKGIWSNYVKTGTIFIDILPIIPLDVFCFIGKTEREQWRLLAFLKMNRMIKLVTVRISRCFMVTCPIRNFCLEYKVLVRVQCHDAMITNEINLFGLARVEDECKTQKRFIEFVIIPS